MANERNPERRPDPDALLALAEKEKRGRLLVFLGAAPGVGKTYAMLQRARLLRQEGVDVVIGLVETHSRSDTEALIRGLEILPRRVVRWQDRQIEEFDLDGALRRRPKLIIVDELAHTNAPESRHPKRWQDVEELLDARYRRLDRAQHPAPGKSRRRRLARHRRHREPAKPFQDFLQEGRWAAEYSLEAVFPAPLPDELKYRPARLCLGEETKIRGAEILKSHGLELPFVIHPGSGSPQKNAPLSFFQTAAQKAVEESGRQVLVVWGEAEDKNIQEIRKTFAGMKDVLVLPSPINLRDLAGVFSQSTAYLGNDSGVTQLASACGLRTFAVFNTTDTHIWAPQQAVILAAMKSLYSSGG